jgi:hypothetical protein
MEQIQKRTARQAPPFREAARKRLRDLPPNATRVKAALG